MQNIKKLLKDKKAEIKISQIVFSAIIFIVILIALVPAIRTFTDTTRLSCEHNATHQFVVNTSLCCNTTAGDISCDNANNIRVLNATERTLLGLVVLLLILGLIFLIGINTGLIKRKN